jgi:hypothetical protein
LEVMAQMLCRALPLHDADVGAHSNS